MSWHDHETVDWFSPIKLHKPTTLSDPTHCACVQDMSIRPIHVEGINLGQVTDAGSWAVESAHSFVWSFVRSVSAESNRPLFWQQKSLLKIGINTWWRNLLFDKSRPLNRCISIAFVLARLALKHQQSRRRYHPMATGAVSRGRGQLMSHYGIATVPLRQTISHASRVGPLSTTYRNCLLSAGWRKETY